MRITKIFIKVKKVVKNQVSIGNLKFTKLKSPFKIHTALKIKYLIIINDIYLFC